LVATWHIQSEVTFTQLILRNYKNGPRHLLEFICTVLFDHGILDSKLIPDLVEFVEHFEACLEFVAYVQTFGKNLLRNLLSFWIFLVVEADDG